MLTQEELNRIDSQLNTPTKPIKEYDKCQWCGKDKPKNELKKCIKCERKIAKWKRKWEKYKKNPF